MRNEDEFRREISVREHIYDSDIIIGIRGWHTPEGIVVTGAIDATIDATTAPSADQFSMFWINILLKYCILVLKIARNEFIYLDSFWVFFEILFF